MNLWNAVNEFLNDYYASFGSVDAGLSGSGNQLKDIIDNAAKNNAFRLKLINSPVETLAKEGFKLPAGFNVKFVEETDDTLYIPIPPYIGD
jgi:hypothetical protein